VRPKLCEGQAPRLFRLAKPCPDLIAHPPEVDVQAADLFVQFPVVLDQLDQPRLDALVGRKASLVDLWSGRVPKTAEDAHLSPKDRTPCRPEANKG